MKSRGFRIDPSDSSGGFAALESLSSRELSSREIEVLCLVVEGLSNDQIGRHLLISRHTVANHVRRIIGKIGVSNRTNAAVYAVRHGINCTQHDE